MYKNYFKTAWRNLVRNKMFGFINIFGLAASMSVCLIIILIINDQHSYDNFISYRDRVYRVHTQAEDRSSRPTATSAFPFTSELHNFNAEKIRRPCSEILAVICFIKKKAYPLTDILQMVICLRYLITIERR